jgi:hypothetical protein
MPRFIARCCSSFLPAREFAPACADELRAAADLFLFPKVSRSVEIALPAAVSNHEGDLHEGAREPKSLRWMNRRIGRRFARRVVDGGIEAQRFPAEMAFRVPWRKESDTSPRISGLARVFVTDTDTICKHSDEISSGEVASSRGKRFLPSCGLASCGEVAGCGTGGGSDGEPQRVAAQSAPERAALRGRDRGVAFSCERC